MRPGPHRCSSTTPCRQSLMVLLLLVDGDWRSTALEANGLRVKVRVPMGTMDALRSLSYPTFSPVSTEFRAQYSIAIPLMTGSHCSAFLHIASSTIFSTAAGCRFVQTSCLLVERLNDVQMKLSKHLAEIAYSMTSRIAMSTPSLPCIFLGY